MIDYHVHIGQFNNTYYDAFDVFKAIEESYTTTKVNQIFYSSTSTCRDDVEFSKIEEEIFYSQNFSSNVLKVSPYLWYNPKYIQQGISLYTVINHFDYTGIKIHPFGQHWDFSNSKHINCLNDLFSWADQYNKYILIHCGNDFCDLPSRFLDFFVRYPNSKPILAHSTPVQMTSKIINIQKNVYCDTAMISKKIIKQLKSSITDKDKILFGSDFPVSHYWNNIFSNKKISLSKQYLLDCKNLRYFI